MSNNKQSSVEWLVEQIKKDTNLRLRGFDIDKALEQAKAMHKEEINDAYFLGYGDHQTLDWHDFDDYYNETYNQ